MTPPPTVLVSAIVSTFNAARFMRGCIEDLERQTISDKIEIIIVDSASEQNEGAIVREFQERYRNIRYRRTEQRESVYAAWNRGIRMAHGKYITNANTDDRHRANAFAHMTQVLEKRPEIALVYADVFKTETENETFTRFTGTGGYRWYDWDRHVLLTKGCFIGPQPMWRRSVHDLYGYFDESMVTSGDYEFWLRISQTFDFHHIREPLGLYLDSPGSIEHRNLGLQRVENVRILSLYQNAASTGEIVRCLPLEQLKQIAWNDSCRSNNRLPAIIGQLEDLVGLNQRLTGGRAENPQSDANRFFDLKMQLLKADTPAVVVDEFVNLCSELSLNRTEWFPRYQKSSEARNRFSSRYTIKTADRPNTGDKDMLAVEQVYEAMQPVLLASRPEDAVRALQNIVRFFPNFARAHNDLGMLYYQSGEKQKATVHYERAATISPENADFQKNLADYYYVEMARAEDALKLYSKVLQARPKDVETLMTAGHILVSLQRFEEADAYYRKVLEIEPWNTAANEIHNKLSQRNRGGNGSRKAEDMYAEVKRLLDLGDQAGARRQLEKMLGICPHFALAHNDIAVLCYQSGDKDQALRHYEEAVRLQPENSTFQKNLGDFYYIEQGRIEDALRIYVHILETQPKDIETLMVTGHICSSLSRWDDARTFYRRVLEIEPWKTEARKQLDRLEKASTGAASLQFAPSAQEMYAEAARLISAGSIQAGKDGLTQLVKLHPDFALAHNDLGVLAFKKGEHDVAEGWFRKAIESDPGFGESYTNLGSLKWAAGETEEAIKLFERGFILSPTVNDVATAYHNAVVEMKSFEIAETVFREARALHPNHKRIAFLLIALLLQQEKHESAMHEIEKAMIQFGIDDGILSAGLEIRKRIGALEIDKSKRGRATLTLCMIVKDEEPHLAKCLMSVKPIVDEMIVVDTGSSDRTKSIAASLGATVFDYPWTNDFSKARNYSLSKASGDWILVLDADEVVSPLDQGMLRKITKKHPAKRVAYSMVTRNYTNNPGSGGWVANEGRYAEEEAGNGWVSSSKVRLFVNDKRIQFVNPVHELVEPALSKLGIQIKACDVPVHHYGRLDQDKVISKGKEYYRLGIAKIEQTNGDCNALKELAIQASEIGEYEEAVKVWRKIIELQPNDAAAHMNMGFAFLMMRQYDRAIQFSKIAMQLDPELREAALNYSGAEMIAGDVHTAVSTLEHIMEKHADYPPAMGRLAAAYIVSGRKEEGLRYLEKLNSRGFDCASVLKEQALAFMAESKVEAAVSLLISAVEKGIGNGHMNDLLAECRSKIDCPAPIGDPIDFPNSLQRQSSEQNDNSVAL